MTLHDLGTMSIASAQRPARGWDDAPAIALAADLAHDGSFGEEWLVIEAGRLRVYAGDPAHVAPRLDLALGELAEPRVETLVGGGALVATVHDIPIELIRYTNARQAAFARVAKYLEDLVAARLARSNGEDAAVPMLAADTEEDRRCPTCRLPLPKGTTVCPACMNKGKVLARLATDLRPYWKQTALLCAMILSSSALGLVAPYLTRPLMDVVLATPPDRALPYDQRKAARGGNAMRIFKI